MAVLSSRGVDSRALQLLRKMKLQGRAADAVALLGSLRRCALRINKIHVTEALSACKRSASWETAASLLKMAQESRIRPDAQLASAAISACGQKWQLALDMFDSLASGSLQNYVAVSSAMSACGKSSKWELSLHLFLMMEESRLEIGTVVLSTAISAACRGQCWELSVLLFASARHKDSLMYNAMISACADGSQWQIALSLFDSMSRESTEQTSTTYNAALTALERAAAWASALALFKRMPAPMTTSYNATISACEKGGQWKHGLSLLQATVNMQLADTTSFNAAMAGCEKAELWTHALALFAEMPVFSLDRDSISYNVAIAALAGRSAWRDMTRLLTECVSSQAVPDVRSWGTCVAELEGCNLHEGNFLHKLCEHFFLGQVAPILSPSISNMQRASGSEFRQSAGDPCRKHQLGACCYELWAAAQRC